MATLARLALVLGIALLCGLAAYAFSESQEERFRASTLLSFDVTLRPDLFITGDFPNVEPWDDGPAQTNAGTVGSRDVAVRTAAALDLDVDDVEDDVTVSVDRGTAIVRISATSTSRDRAKELVQTYRTQYKLLTQRREATRARAARESYERRLAAIGGARATGGLASSLRDRILAHSALEREGSGLPEVIEAAHATDDPAEPRTRRNVLFGLLFGFVLGVGLTALLRDRTRDRAPRAVRDDIDD